MNDPLKIKNLRAEIAIIVKFQFPMGLADRIPELFLISIQKAKLGMIFFDRNGMES